MDITSPGTTSPNPYAELHAKEVVDAARAKRAVRYLIALGLSLVVLGGGGVALAATNTFEPAGAICIVTSIAALFAFLFFGLIDIPDEIRSEVPHALRELLAERTATGTYGAYLDEFALAYPGEPRPDIRRDLDFVCGFTQGEQGELVDDLETDQREAALWGLMNYAWPVAKRYGRNEARRRLTSAPAAAGTRAAEIVSAAVEATRSASSV